MSAQSSLIDHATALIGFDELVGLLHAVFVKHGTSPEAAAILAHNCASAERDGAHSHGIFRIPGYLSTLKSAAGLTATPRRLSRMWHRASCG